VRDGYSASHSIDDEGSDPAMDDVGETRRRCPARPRLDQPAGSWL